MLTLPNPHAEQRDALLACPFCGSLEVRLDLIRMAQVVNCECGARGAGQPSGKRAIAAWNNRPALIDHLEADGGALRAALAKATVISAYSIADPLAVRIVFDSDEDRAAFADAIDGIPATGEGDAMVSVPRDDDEREFADSILPDAMIEAGVAALEKVDEDHRTYVPGESADWDYGMVAVAVYRAMIAASEAAPSVATGEGDDGVA